MNKRIWIVGSGQMALDYSRVLMSFEIDFKIIGRGQKSAKELEKKINKNVITGGIKKALNNYRHPEYIIVAVAIKDLYSVTNEILLHSEISHILIEKPGSLYKKLLIDLKEKSSKRNLLIAYNRRFYNSTLKLKECLDNEGGITSLNFEFTEWSNKISILNTDVDVKSNWLLANSSHVIDLAFYLSGRPKNEFWFAIQEGSINWHPAGARFQGAGITERNILFSYKADWTSPGRWGLEINTLKSRYILSPLEILKRIPIGKLDYEIVQVENELDEKFKPGLYNQCKSFIEKDFSQFCTLDDQIKSFDIYKKIGGYK